MYCYSFMKNSQSDRAARSRASFRTFLSRKEKYTASSCANKKTARVIGKIYDADPDFPHFFRRIAKKLKILRKNVDKREFLVYDTNNPKNTGKYSGKDNYNGTQILYDDGYDDGHAHVHVYDDARAKFVIIVSSGVSLFL